MCFFVKKRWAPFCEVKQSWAAFFSGFSGILPRFSGLLPEFLTHQNFSGCTCIPELQPPTPLLERHSTPIFLVLIFIPAWPHAAANRSSACTAGPVEVMLTVPNRPHKKTVFLRLPTAITSLTLLSLFIPFIHTMGRSGDNTHPCRSPALTLNFCD